MAQLTFESDVDLHLHELLEDRERSAAFLRLRVEIAPGGEYTDWKSLRLLKSPHGLSHEDWWYLVKKTRTVVSRPLPIWDAHGDSYTLAQPIVLTDRLLRLDRQITILEQDHTDSTFMNKIATRSQIDEAIATSQIEGDIISRDAGRQFLRSGRKPAGRGQWQVYQSVIALKFIKTIKNQHLTPAGILELHEVVTLNGSTSNDPLHTPPPAEELESRIRRLCDFANGEVPDYPIHPLVRAALLHWGLLNEHPFVKGNGQVARALFYWSMLNAGYSVAASISISSLIHESTSEYRAAFQQTQTDERDTTYFVLYHLNLVERALELLSIARSQERSEQRSTEALLRPSLMLNPRQLALLGHAIRNPEATYTIKSHQTIHNVVYETARTDLLDLAGDGLLEQVQKGQAFLFRPVSGLQSEPRNL